MRLEFGNCVLDTDRRRLERGGEPVHLALKTYQLLELLVQRRPAALSKQELQDAIWPDVFVAESSLTNLVTQLRQALGDDARHPRLVRTVHGFGYAFEEAGFERRGTPRRQAGMICRLVLDGREVELEAGETILGRGREADVWLSDEQASRRHARISLGSSSATIEDLESRNGTFLREERLKGSVALTDGDEIRIGDTTLRVRLAAPERSTVTRIEPSEG
ncbi:MAG: winged helix-turn-helix domain-containing protein [Thermoanaerobaculia bacterium]|nr:winged helix-turn-helix domain-containing protein [Thermoanaerobaculia bacterium]